MIRVVTADDHALIRQGITRIIDKTADIRVVGEAENGPELLRVIAETPCDVAVIDVSMPDTDVFELLDRLRSRCPDMPVLVLSMHAEDTHAVRLLKAGASGYLCKSTALSDLVTAIRRVHTGKRYVSQWLADELLCRLDGDTPQLPHETLSEREFQVLCHIAAGNTVSEIADDLGLSVKTISTYRARLLEKMQMENNAQLTYYAIQNRLV